MWMRVTKFDPRAAALADRHYNRRKIGSPQFMPPGETVVLLWDDESAVFGWWRPHPNSGIKQMNGLNGWTCTIFRSESPCLSSGMILEAEDFLKGLHVSIGPDGLLTYVWDKKVKSCNPGYCFKMAGWKVIGRSADGKKTLLQKQVMRTDFGPPPYDGSHNPDPTDPEARLKKVMEDKEEYCNRRWPGLFIEEGKR